MKKKKCSPKKMNDGGLIEEVKKKKNKKFSGWGKLLTKYAEKPKKTKAEYEEITRQNAKNKVKHV